MSIQSSGSWWSHNEVKNLAALSTALLDDLGPLLPVSSGEWSPITLQAQRVKQLAESLLKKYEYLTNADADTAALDKFRGVNERCGNYELILETETDHLLLGELRSTLYKFWYRNGSTPLISSFSQILDEARVGPGSSLGANGTDFYTKLFSSKLTSTSLGLYKAYSSYISSLPDWEKAENLRELLYGEVNVVEGNKLSFVPKNVDISRCIATEPSLNMYFQLGVMAILERRINHYFGIDFSLQQPKNRDLAQLASMFDNHWVTIDLSSASDSLAMKMLEKVLPSEFLGWLVPFRSPSMQLPDGSKLSLEMISTMGNGYTFPLQTLLFASVVQAAHRVAGYPLDRPRGDRLGNFAVFGDDIICRSEVSDLVLRLLHLLGFKVNDSKSFFKGPFRESCGGDFFKGHQTRGVYIKRLTSEQDAYVAINALNRWTALTGIYLPRTVRLLVKWVRKHGKPLYVPLYENDDAGLKVPRSLVNSKNLLRDADVQAVKYRAYSASPQCFRIDYDKELILGPKRFTRRLHFNPCGLFVAYLGGYISDGKVGIRHDTVFYQTKLRVVPYWDYLGSLDGIAPSESLLPLGMAIEANVGR